MEQLTYILCTVTSLICFALLFRAYVRSKSRLVFWSALCFLFFAIENGLVFCDLVIFPRVDLSLWRYLAGLLGVGALLYGLIWEVE